MRHDEDAAMRSRELVPVTVAAMMAAALLMAMRSHPGPQREELQESMGDRYGMDRYAKMERKAADLIHSHEVNSGSLRGSRNREALMRIRKYERRERLRRIEEEIRRYGLAGEEERQMGQGGIEAGRRRE
ncbi:hypothetical protein GUITHDRAFT_119560 [Guillardia theta CCMP2712]|uniref:Uncharacterized protein n=1 Tax=Guillardia theta (strain CCMP2712) TaxID=905079 RepID=L1IEN0_GUITC|nr:hypothetical protein GUITHDRAFT_119560 [Guillardia theta CCMP2712]EKX34270.1 hypothetical protein GUITHDRAFT_119560 [Guillardia theta CCMP2712]|eukprot:XP_005821250.1 hypothetical protein GUITHDRAFT_119560 [Guillardia theta CCMP2712]